LNVSYWRTTAPWFSCFANTDRIRRRSPVDGFAMTRAFS
jgi:hypothetical protein